MVMRTESRDTNPQSDVPVFGRRVEGCPYVVRPSAYALVRNGANALAVARTVMGCYLPGGGLEAGESAEQAIEREAMEECGLVVRARVLLGSAIEIVYSSSEKTCFEKRCTFYETDLLGMSSPTHNAHELVWLSVDQAVQTLSHESHRWAVRRLVGKTV